MAGVRGRVASDCAAVRGGGPVRVAVRTRLKGLTSADERVLRAVGAHLGSLAARDLKARCADGLNHGADRWSARKRELTGVSSARWAGAITKATHDQWALARRSQYAHLQSLEAGVKTIERRLALPIGAKGTKRAPGGYRSRREWVAKSRRLRVLQGRLARVRADFEAGWCMWCGAASAWPAPGTISMRPG